MSEERDQETAMQAERCPHGADVDGEWWCPCHNAGLTVLFDEPSPYASTGTGV